MIKKLDQLDSCYLFCGFLFICLLNSCRNDTKTTVNSSVKAKELKVLCFPEVTYYANESIDTSSKVASVAFCNEDSFLISEIEYSPKFIPEKESFRSFFAKRDSGGNEPGYGLDIFYDTSGNVQHVEIVAIFKGGGVGRKRHKVISQRYFEENWPNEYKNWAKKMQSDGRIYPIDTYH